MKKINASARWYRLLPVVFITYSLAYLDRANFGFGLAGEMTEDLHISSGMSSLLGSLFFLGYFFFQIPGVYYTNGKSIKKLIFWSLILWGLLATATGLTRNINMLMVIRFMLGVVESAVFPCLVVFLSKWFTKAERAKANTFLIFGNPVTILWMSVLSGYLIHALGWRWMFIWEGIPAVLWAFFWWAMIVDRPKDAIWLSQEEKDDLEAKLHNEQKQIKPVKNYLEAFRSRSVLLLCLVYTLWSIAVYGFVIWLPSIIHEAPGINMVRTGWLSAFPYLMAVIGMVAVSYFSDITLKRKPFVWGPLLISAISFYCSYLVGKNDFWLSFGLFSVAGMAMYAPYGPFFSIITERLPSNVAGGAIALINSFGALGSFVGSYLVGYLRGVTGTFTASYLFMAIALLLSAILVLPAVQETKVRLDQNKVHPELKGIKE